MRIRNLIPKKFRAMGSLVKNSKGEKRQAYKLTSKHKDILKSLFDLPVSSNWLSDIEIDKIERDSTVTAAKGSRKAHVLKKEIFITCKDDVIREKLESVFDYDTLDSILDTPYQGVGTFELNWEEEEYYLYPRLVERNYKEFVLDNTVLKYAANGMPEDIMDHKALYAVYKAKPLKPYGQPLYNPLFWLIEFKNASLEFWVELLERFGTPWVISKTEGDKELLADEIYNMLGGDGAVLDTEDSIEIVTAKDKGDFKEIIEYIDNQIREVILGGNLTGQVKGGSQAAATVHNDIRVDLAKADENIVNKIIKSVIDSFKKLNQINDDITGQLKDKDDVNKDLADRDKTISEMGYIPTQEYIEKTYNIQVEKKESEPKVFPNSIKAFAKTYQDELHVQSSKIDTIDPLTFQKQIIKAIENSNSYEEAFDNLAALYPKIDTVDLEDNLFKYLANSSILGASEVDEENPNG